MMLQCKTIFLLTTCLLLTGSVLHGKNQHGTNRNSSNTPSFIDDSAIIQAGCSFGLSGTYGAMTVPPVYVLIEYHDYITPFLPLSFGSMLGYARSKEVHATPFGDWTVDYNYYILGVRASFHFCKLITIKNSDLYAGVTAALNYVDREEAIPEGIPAEYDVNPGDSYLLYGIYLGLRYYIKHDLSVVIEGGTGLAYVKGGIAYRF